MTGSDLPKPPIHRFMKPAIPVAIRAPPGVVEPVRTVQNLKRFAGAITDGLRAVGACRAKPNNSCSSADGGTGRYKGARLLAPEDQAGVVAVG